MHTNTNPAIATLFLWLFLVAITCNFNVGFSYGGVDGGMNCIENERDALLKIKNGLKDPYGRLVSWTVGSSNDDCCGWYGVVCDNSTGHVLQLHLRGLDNYYLESPTVFVGISQSPTVFGGKISQSLLNLTHLTHLDLSYNWFDGIQIPKFLGSMESLTYLNLSHAGFGHSIPPQLGNLTNLIHLDISGRYSYSHSSSDDVHWLSGLSSLQFLDLSGRNLSQNLNWFEVIPKLHFLQELHLDGCQLPSPPSILNLNSSSSLVVLTLSGNYFSKAIVSWISHFKHLKSLNLAFNFLLGSKNLHEFRNLSTSLTQLDLTSIGFNSSIPNWLYDFANLELLNLAYNDLRGQISDAIANMTSLITLDLSGNTPEGIPASFQKLCNLRTLSLSNANLNQDINKIFENLVGCGSNDLESLILGSEPFLLHRNSIFGEIPMSLGEFHSLRYLDLSNNKLNGTIPESFGRLSNLKGVDISHNLMEGDVSEIHFANLSSLLAFSANGNKLNLKVGLDWIPPPQLEVLGLRSWNVGPQIPLLPSLKNLIELDLSNSGISTSSLPVWFWSLTSQLTYLNISHNNIQGVLPNRLTFPEYTDLSSNNFQGSLPLVSSYHIVVLDLSNNSFSGSVSNFLCRRTTDSLGGVLNLENNLLEGEIPNCWNKLPNLVALRLSHNKFNGSIPASIGSLNMLKSLHLCNNSLSGEVPLSLENCTQLVTFDVGENKLEGNIPRWIGEKLLDLIILDMGTNSFVGSIPPEICRAHNLHILHLANNNLSGTIPTCLSNFSVMANMTPSGYLSSIFLGFGGGKIRTSVIDSMKILNKGSDSEYNTILQLVKSVDLSNNRLYGEIPEEITSLKALLSLNLSHNYLSGRIPKNIGSMAWLESIDLSSNKLSGEIPPSISSLTFLSHLNLSHNKLSGKIPSSTQIQSFDSSCFIGNIELCGKPLADNCSGDGAVIIPSSKENGEESDSHGSEMVWFYATIAVGFIVGFWGVVGPLVFNRNWRLNYFQFLQRMEDKIYIWWHLL